jgi:hypothetical protein
MLEGMAARTCRTPKNRAAFLTTLAQTCSVLRACEAVGFARSAAYRWRDEDAAFRAEWDGVIEGIVDQAEGTMLRQARDDETAVGLAARQTILRAHRPETYNRGLMLRHQMMQLAIEEKRQQLGVTIDGHVVNGNGPVIYPRRDLERTDAATESNNTLSIAVWIDAMLELTEQAEEVGDGL